MKKMVCRQESVTILIICIAGIFLSCAGGCKTPFTGDDNKDVIIEKQKTAFVPRVEQKKIPVVKNDSMTKIFDFNGNLEKAHFRSGGLLIDFGTTSRNKYTMGDWKSGFSGNFADENKKTTFSRLGSKKATIFFDALPMEVPGADFVFYGSSKKKCLITVYLDEKQIGKIVFEKGQKIHQKVSSSDGVKTGQNTLMLRASAGCVHKDGLLLDYVRVTSQNTSTVGSASTVHSILIKEPGGKSDAIALQNGESLSYNLHLFKGIQFQTTIVPRQKKQKGSLEISLYSNDNKIFFSRTVLADSTKKTFTIDVPPPPSGIGTFIITSVADEVVIKEMRLIYPSLKKTSEAPLAGVKNIIWILIDTLRADKLSFLNAGTRVRTTFLDELSRQSVVFSQVTVPENWTKPSIASMFTGLFPSTHNTKDGKDSLPGTVTTVFEHFSKLGFVTAGFIANGYISDKFGFKRGFDYYTNYVREGKPNRAKFVFEDAAGWLKKKNNDKPFLLYIHTIDPHVPYIPPKKYWSIYDSGSYNGSIEPVKTAKITERIKKGTLKLSERDKIRLEALYDGEITYHDDQMAGFFDYLKTTNLMDNTLIIVTSDHGEEFFEHSLVGHGHSLYEELLHVPLLIRFPGSLKNKPKEIKADVGLEDLFPTVCEIAGIECPAEVEGHSLIGLIEGRESGYLFSSFSEFLKGQRSVKINNYKMICKGLSMKVYDLKKDPLETTDFSPQLPAVTAMLRDALGLHLGRFSTKAANKNKVHVSEKAVIDSETQRQLRALGYIND